jgi:hypothetical protein
VRTYGPHAIWKDVGQRLLDNTPLTRFYMMHSLRRLLYTTKQEYKRQKRSLSRQREQQDEQSASNEPAHEKEAL